MNSAWCAGLLSLWGIFLLASSGQLHCACMGWRWSGRMFVSPRSTMPVTKWCPTDSSSQFTWLNIMSYLTSNESSKHLENFYQMSYIQKVVRIQGKAWLSQWACLFFWLTANMLIKHFLTLFLPCFILPDYRPFHFILTRSPDALTYFILWPTDTFPSSCLSSFLSFFGFSSKAVLGCS